MESERAQKYLNSNKWKERETCPLENVRLYIAEEAVEMAEEEMKEAAIKAFRSVHCSKCKYEWNCTNSFGCNDYDAFIQQLDKNK